ncbi:MAG: hypothetical protein HQL52_01115 [Magnetococcales bacterium]|nr:hypothetical protein [Magnetococcales bacterium]
MGTTVITTLAAQDSLQLTGPGLVKLKTANSVTLSKVGAAKSVAMVKAQTGLLNGGAGVALTTLGPILGMAVLTVGLYWLIKETAAPDAAVPPVAAKTIEEPAQS